MLDEAWAVGTARVLDAVAALARSGDAWVVPGNVFADWQLARS
jgi:hypothetical protein